MLTPGIVSTGQCLVSPVTDDWSPEPGLDGCNLSREAWLAPAPTWLRLPVNITTQTSDREGQPPEITLHWHLSVELILITCVSWSHTIKVDRSWPFLAENSSTQEGGWPRCVIPTGQGSPACVTSPGGFTNVSPTSSQITQTRITGCGHQAQGPGQVMVSWWGPTPSTVQNYTGRWAPTQTHLTEGLFFVRCEKDFGKILFDSSVFWM